MSLSRLASKCRGCPHVDTCDHKEMEAYGVLPLPGPAASPTSYEMDSRKATDEIYNDMDKLVRTIARVVQLPEYVLRGDHLRR